MNHSSALVYSTQLRVSVYSTGTCIINSSGFSWEHDYLRYHLAQALSVLSGSTLSADLPTEIYVYTLQPTIRQLAEVSLLRLHIPHTSSNGILTVSSIGIAVRLSLRPRLTLIRLALIRKP